MKLYRLKKEAVEYFDKKYATAIRDWDAWHTTGVGIVTGKQIGRAHV